VVTPKDEEDLKFIAGLDPEFVAASFIGTGADVEQVRSELVKHGNPNIKIIAKLERPVALLNLDDIIRASDALMVARGDLGVEIDAWVSCRVSRIEPLTSTALRLLPVSSLVRPLLKVT
jgi:pyruvate kinase